MKQCYACKQKLPDSSYTSNNNTVDGLQNYCKKCYNIKYNDRENYKSRKNMKNY